MARRSCASAVINFGLVCIPVKFYVSAAAVNVSFCLLSSKGNRVSQKYVDKITLEDVEHNVMNKGYVLEDESVIKFTKEEIKALEETGPGEINIKEFVPADQVDLLHVEKSYHLSPGKGGDRAYIMLSKALKKTNQYAIAQWTARGKQHLVVIRPYQDGLVIHQMFYANEIREFESDVAKLNVSDQEVDMACKLINTLQKDTYNVSEYVDSYQERVRKAVVDKAAGKKVNIDAEPVKTNVSDLFEALKASLEKTGTK